MERGFIGPDGTYWQTNSDPSDEIRAAYPAGTIAVPIRPNHLHTWDGENWMPPSSQVWDEYVGKQVRFERDMRLVNDVDPVVTNPLRWEDLGDFGRAEWTAYRRSLLDITEQNKISHFKIIE